MNNHYFVRYVSRGRGFSAKAGEGCLRTRVFITVVFVMDRLCRVFYALNRVSIVSGQDQLVSILSLACCDIKLILKVSEPLAMISRRKI